MATPYQFAVAHPDNGGELGVVHAGMVNDRDLDSLPARVDDLGPSGPGRRFPSQLRDELQRVCSALSKEWTQRELADRLGLSVGTVQRYQNTPEPGAAMVPVEITESRPGALRIVMPSGAVVDGLDMDSATELLRRLG